jgi:hypothetical protein
MTFTMVFEVQSFFCLDGNKPVGLCGKGKNKDGSYKRGKGDEMKRSRNFRKQI